MSTEMFDRDILVGMLEQECLSVTGTSAAVIGAHKVGKTHLLDYICDRPNKARENLFCNVDRYLLRASCRTGESLNDHVFLRFFLSALLSQINDLIETQSAEQERWQAAIEQAEALAQRKKQNNDETTYEEQLSDIRALKQKMQELEVLQTVSKKIERLTEQPNPIAIYQVTSIIDKLQKIGKRIVLVIDEYNQLVKEPNLTDDLFSFLRGANNRRKIIALVTSPVDLMDPSLHDDRMTPGREDLFNYFHTKILYPFDDAEANTFLDWLGTTPALNEDERAYIRKLGGGSPYFLKEALQYFNAYGRPAEDSARRDFERKILGPALENPFRQVWGRCSPEARAVLGQLATGEAADEGSPAFVFLETAGYIIRTKSGVSLFSSLFSEFAKRQSKFSIGISRSAATVQEGGWLLAKGVSVKAELLYTTIPSALFYISREHAELVRFEIKNTTSEPKQIMLTCQVPGFMPVAESKTVTAPPGTTHVSMNVTLDNVSVDRLVKPVPATVQFGAFLTNSDQRVPLQETRQIRFLPKNNFLMARYDPLQKTSKLMDFTWLITAWISDDENTLNDIRQKAMKINAALGYDVPEGDPGAGPIQKKVEALYEALRTRGVEYHNHTLVFHKAENEFVQRVRLPRETLAHNTANCLEGAVLFASLLAFNDLDPAILLTPGHALVGWKDRKGKQFEWNFLEITSISKNATFAEAFTEGQEKYQKAQVSGHLSAAGKDSILDPNDFAILLDVRRVWQDHQITPL